MQLITMVAAFIGMATTDGKQLTECGVSAVYACLKDLGADVSLGEIRTDFLKMTPAPDLDMLKMAELRYVVEKHACRATGIKVTPTETSFAKLQTPCIVHIDVRGGVRPLEETSSAWGHYAVLHSIDHDKGVVSVSDLTIPVARHEMPLAEVAKFATGYVLVVERADWLAPWLKIALMINVGILGILLLWRRHP